jgi:hypothetical protein
LIFIDPVRFQSSLYKHEAFVPTTQRQLLSCGLLGYLKDVPVLQRKGIEAAEGFLLLNQHN